jgi:hypothetical protein
MSLPERTGHESRQASEMVELPPQRPPRETLILVAMVITVTVLAAVILFAATEGLWLGVHGKL